MKYLFLLLSTILALSCMGEKYKVGDCIQKPDESSVWKITKFNEGLAVLNQQTKVSGTQTKEVNLPSGYIKTRCR